eukprot:5035291-Prymnesium_polylepis.1
MECARCHRRLLPPCLRCRDLPLAFQLRQCHSQPASRERTFGSIGSSPHVVTPDFSSAGGKGEDIYNG